MSRVFSHISSGFKMHRTPNGAVLYSKDILKYFVPRVKTDRNWVTVRRPPHCFDHSIVFIHDNLKPQRYYYLKKFNDLVLVCSQKTTMEKVREFGRPIYLPLSVDVNYVKQFRTKKTKDKCYAGRRGKPGTQKYLGDRLENLPHATLLRKMAEYKYVYAVGRTAIEAKILGCEILPYDPRFPDHSVWEIIDSKEGAKMLQEELDKIDGGKSEEPHSKRDEKTARQTSPNRLQIQRRILS